MPLIDLLTPARVRAGVSVSNKTEALEAAAGLLAEGRDEAFRQCLFTALSSREKLGSTGLGHGIAIPHGRTDGLDAAVGAVLRLDQPIAFDASDGQPVDLLFALAVPQHFTHQHLQLLAQLAEMFGDRPFTDALRAASADDLFGLLSGWRQNRAVA